MSQNDKKHQPRKSKPNGFFVRFKPSTADWLRERVNDDEPTVPAVIRGDIEEKRRQTQCKQRKR